MKVSFNWLQEHVDLSDLAVEQLCAKLTALGLEVASVERKGPTFKGVVTAKILEAAKHPNADRLRLCVVDDGSQKLSVVCGAPNAAAGLIVALARVGGSADDGELL